MGALVFVGGFFVILPALAFVADHYLQGVAKKFTL